MSSETQAETAFLSKQHSSVQNEQEDKIEHPSDVIGSWGPTQRRVISYLILVYCVAPFSNSHIVFTAPSNVDFYCVDVDPLTNTSVYLKNSCTIGNYTEAPKCQIFEHDRSFHKRTLVNTFDLVCDKAWYPSFSQSLHQLGYAVSGVTFGMISDSYGRFFAAKIAIAVEIIAGFGQAFAPNIYLYWFARFFIGLASYGRFLNGYILISEWVGPKLRGKFSMAIADIGALVGASFLVAAFYFYPDYFVIEVTVRILEILLFTGYIFVVKESPRWLLTHGKWKEAEKLLKSAALEKGVYNEQEIDKRIAKLKEFTINEQEKLKKEKQEKPSILDIWRDPKLLKTSLILYFSWFSLAFVAYASGLNVGQLGGSVYAIGLFALLAGIPVILFSYWVVGRFERKTLGRTSLYVMAVSSLGSMLCALSPSLLIPLVILVQLYESLGGITFGTLYLMSAEFFPTTMRQTSMGVCSLFARAGSIIAPFMKELTIATSLWVSFAIFTALTVTTATLWMFLPETMDIQLPDNVLQSKRVEKGEERVKARRISHRESLA